MKRMIVMAFAAVALMGCKSNEADICGTWVHTPRQGWGVGFKLNEDGTAKAMNMGSLVFDTWERDGDKLIIRGVDVVNRLGMEFTDTLTIEKLTRDSLFVRSGEREFHLGRLN